MNFICPVSSSHRPGPSTVFNPERTVTDLYLPRCFAYSKYGAPEKESKFPMYSTIDVPFSGSLRPIQETVVEAYIQEVKHGSGSEINRLQCGAEKTCALFITYTLWESKHWS
jgi:hypothetical protein